MVIECTAGVETPAGRVLEAMSRQLDELIEVLDGGAGGLFDQGSVVEFLQRFERFRNRLSLVDHRLIAWAERLEVATFMGQNNLRRVLTSLLSISRGEATRRVKSAEAVGPRSSLLGEPLAAVRPQLASAQRAGAVSAEKVDLIVRAVGSVDRPGFDSADIDAAEALLVEQAAVFPPEDLRQIAKHLIDAVDPDGTLPSDQLNADRRHLDIGATRDGAYAGEFRLTGRCGAKLKALLDPLAKVRVDESGEVDVRTFGQRLHDALEEVCDRQLRAGDVVEAGGVPATVVVTIGADDLVDGLGYGRTSDGTLIPTATLLALADQADIIPTVLNASGAVLDLGRTRRIASRSQTLALVARDGGCSFPGCAHPPQYCERHHVRDWILGGLTDLNNLTLLCRYHHHNFLSRGWTVRINSDGLPEWIPPYWVDRDHRPMINTRIRAALLTRTHAQRNRPDTS